VIKIEKLQLQNNMDFISSLHFINGNVTVDGTLLLIESDVLELDYFKRPVTKNTWIIRIIKDGLMKTVELKNVPLIPTGIDLFQDGSILLVQSRCENAGDRVERNARRYNMNGQLIDAFILGDGINTVQIDENDTIWVSYFDEGIFGNFGWEDPIGHSGLASFSISGEKVWEAQGYNMADCCGLNVTNSSNVFSHYYDDLHLVHLTNGQEALRYQVKGSDGFDQFMFDEYGLIAETDRQILTRYKLNKKTFSPSDKINMIDKEGMRIYGPIFMRGRFLYVWGNETIYWR
jgi:hypothetical protein